MTRENHHSVGTRQKASARPALSRFRSALALAAGCAALVVLEGGAMASPEYPGVIGATWGVGQPPWWKGGGGQGCLLCHATETNPDPGKQVTTLFGRFLHITNQLGAADKAGLAKLLGDPAIKNADVDRDHVSNYQELAVDHTNPNDGNDFKRPPPPPPMMDGGGGSDAAPVPTENPPLESAPAQPPMMQTGCSLGSRSTASKDGSAFLGIAISAMVFLMRRRGDLGGRSHCRAADAEA